MCPRLLRQASFLNHAGAEAAGAEVVSDRFRDGVVCALLLAGTLIYLYHWPRDFYGYDEGLYLYEAKRVLDGQIMYRDFFEIVTPGGFYFMALLYALFGVSLETARAGMAVIHGLIGVLAFLICRRLGVRASIALLTALTHLLLGYPACPIASVHWLSTFLTLALVLLVLLRPGTSGPRVLLWGALTGMLILVQQQKGVVMAAAVAGVAALDQTRWPTGSPSLIRRGAAYLGGIVLVVAPVMLTFILVAGLDDVLRALVYHPIVNYPRIVHGKGAFGEYIPGLHPLGFVIAWLALVLPVAITAAVWQWRRGSRPDRDRLVMILFGFFALLSITYNPNYIHIAFVAPLWFILAASLLEALLVAVEREAAAPRVVAPPLMFLLVVGCFWQFGDNLRVRRQRFPFQAATAFGRIDSTGEDAALLQGLRDLWQREQVREIFVYPANPGFYLVSGMENPTRYQIVVPDYTERDQLEEIVATLDARRVPFVVLVLYPGTGALEPLNSYVRTQYAPAELSIGPAVPGWARLKVYRRKPATTSADVRFF